jgi:hypothetical protein
VALTLPAAGVLALHASAATPAGQGQTGTAQAEADQTEAAQAKPYLQMRRDARQRAQARAKARRSARADRAGGDLTADERIAKIVENAWWNDPELVEALHLTDTLRHKMDDLLRANLAGRREALDTGSDAKQAFYAALEAGDPQAAAGHLEAVDQAQAAIVRSQLELRLDVAKLLTPDQRKTLTEARPLLWRERWLRLEPWANTAGRGRGGAKTQTDPGS